MPNTGKFSSCIAMLLGEMPTEPLALINFRQGEFMFRGRVRGDLSPFYTSGILVAALLAVLIVRFTLGVSANLHRLNQVNAEIAAVAGPELGESDPANAKTQLQMGIAKMNKRINLIGGNLDSFAARHAGRGVARAAAAIPGADGGRADRFAGLARDRTGRFVLDRRSSEARARQERLLRHDRSRAREGRL